MIFHEPLDSVLRMASLGLVGEVLSASEPREEGLWISVDIEVLPVEILLGERTRDGALVCRYSQGIPHLRGGARVSPRVTGSGLELRLAKGDRAVFLLGTEGDSGGPLPLLRAEALASLGLVLRARK